MAEKIRLGEKASQSAKSLRLEEPLREAVERALERLGAAEADPALLPAKDASRADFQSGAAFALAKRLGASPREAAERLAQELGGSLEGIARVAVSGAGFVEFSLSEEHVFGKALGEGPLWPDFSEMSVALDYSGPNTAKRMHVGHLRSTVIGDALRGMLEACGARVESINHVGDFGTPFGVILEQARFEGAELSGLSLEGIEALYKRGAARFNADPKTEEDERFASAAREATARLQAGLEPERSGWLVLRESGLAQIQAIYESLGVRLGPESVLGESSYSQLLEPVLEELTRKGVCSIDQGATCFFPEGAASPLLLAKSGPGGALYGATDAAAIKRRAQAGSTHLVYVVDARQSAHFSALFELARKAGWLGAAQPIHAKFGTMLGKDGKPFKTRSGESALLSDLVGMAIEEARRAAAEKDPDASPESLEAVARMVGVGALKYADLSRPREGDIKFDARRFCALEGNTAVFLQYARARARSVAERARGLPMGDAAPTDPRERALALELAKLPGAFAQAAESLSPHLATDALYAVARAFGSFYESCPAIAGEEGAKVASARRVRLCEKVSSALGSALETLGIPSPESLPKAKPKGP